MKLETFEHKQLPGHLSFIAKPFYDAAKGLIRDFPDCDLEKCLKSLRVAQRHAIKAKEDVTDYREPRFDDKEPDELE